MFLSFEKINKLLLIILIMFCYSGCNEVLVGEAANNEEDVACIGLNGGQCGQEPQNNDNDQEAILQNDPQDISGLEALEQPLICGNGIVEENEFCDENTVFCNQCVPEVYVAHDTRQEGALGLDSYKLLSPDGRFLLMTQQSNSHFLYVLQKLERPVSAKVLSTPNLNPSIFFLTSHFSEDGRSLYYSYRDNDGMKHTYRQSLQDISEDAVRLFSDNVNPIPLRNVLYDDSLHMYYIIESGGKSEVWHKNKSTGIQSKLPDGLYAPIFFQNSVYAIISRFVDGDDRRDIIKLTLQADNVFSLTNLTENIAWHAGQIVRWYVSSDQEFLVFMTHNETSPTGDPVIYKLNLTNDRNIRTLVTSVDFPGLQSRYFELHMNNDYIVYSVLDDPYDLNSPASLWLKSLSDVQNSPPVLISANPLNPGNNYKLFSGYSLDIKFDKKGMIYFVGVLFIGGEHIDTVKVLAYDPATLSSVVYSNFTPEQSRFYDLVTSQSLPSIVLLHSSFTQDDVRHQLLQLKKNFIE